MTKKVFLPSPKRKNYLACMAMHMKWVRCCSCNGHTAASDCCALQDASGWPPGAVRRRSLAARVSRCCQ